MTTTEEPWSFKRWVGLAICLAGMGMMIYTRDSARWLTLWILGILISNEARVDWLYRQTPVDRLRADRDNRVK